MPGGVLWRVSARVSESGHHLPGKYYNPWCLRSHLRKIQCHTAL